jgi:hypothetical protein
MAFGRTTNKELRELADEFIDIEDYPDELLFQSRKSIRPQRNEKNKTEKKSSNNASQK